MLALHEGAEVVDVPRIAAQEQVAIEHPQVSVARHHRAEAGQGRQCVVRVLIHRGREVAPVLQQIDLREREAGELHVEFQVAQRPQLGRENCAVPSGIERELVVGEDVGAALRGVEVRQPQRRDAAEPQLRRLQAPMTRDDLAVVADQDRNS